MAGKAKLFENKINEANKPPGYKQGRVEEKKTWAHSGNSGGGKIWLNP